MAPISRNSQPELQPTDIGQDSQGNSQQLDQCFCSPGLAVRCHPGVGAVARPSAKGRVSSIGEKSTSGGGGFARTKARPPWSQRLLFKSQQPWPRPRNSPPKTPAVFLFARAAVARHAQGLLLDGLAESSEVSEGEKRTSGGGFLARAKAPRSCEQPIRLQLCFLFFRQSSGCTGVVAGVRPSADGLAKSSEAREGAKRTSGGAFLARTKAPPLGRVLETAPQHPSCVSGVVVQVRELVGHMLPFRSHRSFGSNPQLRRGFFFEWIAASSSCFRFA
eukprot:CAMPEP_0196660546 /NCGR_PEP_ID=MMETSP1086-20130531/40275_1 /TAXON_ID=77921 /ORGANISM="Cyanoptyche  gloeocystis , Strain SAG4.97" /LENGTH=275 /DNA_ID=CAMNT_0041995013 /DNA_START=168 /DNA_END=997 /DNA_ORIENTATION=-